MVSWEEQLPLIYFTCTLITKTYFTMYSRYDSLQKRIPTPYLRENSFNSWQDGEDKGSIGTAS